MMWDDTADSAVNLGELLPAGYTNSYAIGMDDAGNVYGGAWCSRPAARPVLATAPSCGPCSTPRPPRCFPSLGCSPSAVAERQVGPVGVLSMRPRSWKGYDRTPIAKLFLTGEALWGR